MDAQLQEAAMVVAQEVAAELASQGALAVVLAGSFARGDAGPESDLDLYAIGEGCHYQLERREPFLVSTSWRSVEQERQALRDPARAGGAVPGWRRARILHDPDGVAAKLQSEAGDWSWEVVGDEACNRYVAEEITGLAEEVHKLVTLMQAGPSPAAAVQHSILSFRPGVIMAVHLRLLYDTENVLWDLVNERVGSAWQRAQAAAFGLGDEPFEIICQAALELYALTVREVRELFDARERAVVTHACRIAGFPLEG